jgi:hypothetical protein
MHNNTGYLVPSLCGQTYIYGWHADASVSSRIVAALTMHIDPSILEKALGEAMARFPQMAVGLVQEEERRTFISIGGPVPVFKAEETMPSDFLDPQLCGYLIRVSYHHKHVYVDFHRAIADEYGMISFVKALLLRYLELSGFTVNNDGSVKSLTSEYFEAEGEDPMVKMEDANASRPIWFMDAKALVPPKAEGDSEEVVQVRIPLSKLKKDYMELPTAPVTHVAPFISHALYEILHESMQPGEYVVAGVQINLRSSFPSSSLRPYYTPVSLAYNRNLDEYPYKTVLMSQKKLLEAQLKHDALAYSAQRKIAEVERAFEESSSLAELDAAFDALQAKTAQKSTYNICRIGHVILPESMQRLVSEFYSVIPSWGRTISVTVTTFKGELNITVSGKIYSVEVCKRLVELLQENDIDAYIADRYSFDPLLMKI